MFIGVESGKPGQYENDVFLLFFPSMRNTVQKWITTHWGITTTIENTPPSLHTSTFEQPSSLDTSYKKHLNSLNQSIQFSPAEQKIKKFANITKTYKDILTPTVPTKPVSMENSGTHIGSNPSAVEIELKKIRAENQNLKEQISKIINGYQLLMTTIQESFFNTQNRIQSKVYEELQQAFQSVAVQNNLNYSPNTPFFNRHTNRGTLLLNTGIILRVTYGLLRCQNM